MSSASTLVIAINPLDPLRGEYLIQLARASKTLAEAPTRIDRQRLLELEYGYNAHDYGMALYAALFNGSVSREYQRLVGQVGADDTLRIQLVISDQAGELHALAWERLFHFFGDAESPLATLAQTPFARFLISGASDQAATTADPLRLLLVIANPSQLGADFAAIDGVQTVQTIAAIVAQSKGRVQGTVLAGRSGLPDALRQPLQNAGWTIAEGVSSWQNIQRHLHGQHILHILAHGQWASDRQNPDQSSTYLLLEAEGDDTTARGAWAAVDDKTISTQLSGVHPLPQLIFLAACESARRPATPTAAPANAAARPPITLNPLVGLAPRLVAAGVPAVLAMQDKIEVEMAQTLTRDFYQRLLAHGQVDRALNEARALLYARDSFAWAIPVLFLRLTDGQLFAPPAAPPRRARLQAPAPPATYATRTAEESQLRTWLTANAHPDDPADAALTVAIQGIGGQGKSVLARKVGRDCAAAFPGGVLWVEIGPGAAPSTDNLPSARLEAQQATILSRVARELALDLSAIPTLADRAMLIQGKLGENGRLLAILDDLWDPDLGRWLLRDLLPADHAALITTRQLDLARALAGSQVVRLGSLNDDEALAMLTNLLGPLEPHTETARQIVHQLAGLALALEIGARNCAEGAADLPWLHRQLQNKPTLGVLTLPGQVSRETSLEYTLALSLRDLDAALVARFWALGAFAPAPMSLAALAAVWGDADPDVAESQARRLVQRSLLQRAEDRLPPDAARLEPVYVQHSLLQVYALALAERNQQATNNAQRHADYYAALPQANWQQAELFWLQLEHAWRWNARGNLDQRLDFLRAVENMARLRGLWGPLLAQGEALLVALQTEAARAADQAYLLNVLGAVYSALGDKQAAIEFYNQALPLIRQVDDKGGEAATLNNIGRVYAALGDKPAAIEFYNQALPLIRQVGDKRGEAATLNNIGAVYDDLGDKQQALDYYNQALPLRRQVGDKRGEATTLNNIGRVYDALGDKPAALDYYNQALPLYRQVGDKRGEATTLNNIGGVYDDLGDKPAALDYYNQALPFRRQVGDKGGEATTLNNIGRVYDDLGDKPAALGYYNQALPLFRQVGDKGGEATTLNNIGRVYAALGDKPAALDYYNQALPLRRQVGDKPGEATTLNNIGGVYAALGDKPAALDYYNQALPRYRQVGDKRGEATTLNNMAVMAYQAGDFVSAAQSFAEILKITEQIGDVATTANVLLNLAFVLHHQLGRTAEAIAHLSRSIALLQQKQLPYDAAGSSLADHQTFLAQITSQAAGAAS